MQAPLLQPARLRGVLLSSRFSSRAALTFNGTFKGNKSYLPSKPCAACGRPMLWRKRWARTWEAVRYCSDRCRDGKSKGGAA
jgi:hypothetical protein